jgi:hypothetical protein
MLDGRGLPSLAIGQTLPRTDFLGVMLIRQHVAFPSEIILNCVFSHFFDSEMAQTTTLDHFTTYAVHENGQTR